MELVDIGVARKMAPAMAVPFADVERLRVAALEDKQLVNEHHGRRTFVLAIGLAESPANYFAAGLIVQSITRFSRRVHGRIHALDACES